MKPFGFSNGWAELALNGPPPLVPSSLMASWLAIGPPGIAWLAPSTVVAIVKPSKFWTTPWLTSTQRDDDASGRSTRSVARVRSTQKLPIVPLRRRDEAPDQGDGHRQADRGGHEVLHRRGRPSG